MNVLFPVNLTVSGWQRSSSCRNLNFLSHPNTPGSQVGISAAVLINIVHVVGLQNYNSTTNPDIQYLRAQLQKNMSSTSGP